MADEVIFTGQSGMTWRYWDGKPLGTPGGFGGVYAAEGPDGTSMAVKVVKKQRPSGALDDRLLRREIDIGKRVADSGSQMLLPVIDAADAGDALLLVMPLADGALSAAAIPMDEAEVVPVLVDIATGLQDLHSTGIIHRDLKAANVLRHEGRWKLADFGIARDQEIGTQDPTFVGWGSLPYMAPELWELRSPTVKTDLYALGFRLARADQRLSGFIGYLEQAGARTVTTELALAWSCQPPGGHPAWWRQRLILVRGFAKYLHTLDPATEVPSARLLPSGHCRATPYLYSEADIAGLMAAARALASRCRRRPTKP